MESHDVLEAKSWPVFAGKMVKKKNYLDYLGSQETIFHCEFQLQLSKQKLLMTDQLVANTLEPWIEYLDSKGASNN